MSLETPDLSQKPKENIDSENRREKFEKIKTPEELLSFMTENIAYGFIGKNSKEAYPTDFKKEAEDADFKKEADAAFENEYYIQSPDELLKSRLGVCWDQTELERHWFSGQKPEYNYKALIMFDPKDPKEGITPHTFLAFEKNKKWCWFEHSFQDLRGIHEYDTLEDLIIDVVKKIREAESNYIKKPTAEDLKNIKVCEYETPEFGSGPEEFVLPIVKKNHPDLMTKKE